ncbi:hypothetical protein EV714DRAFT_278477 [Schizophyllum commune]
MWPLLPSTPSPAIYNILDEPKITSTRARSEDDNGASSTLNDPENKVYYVCTPRTRPTPSLTSAAQARAAAADDLGISGAASSCMSATFSNLNDEIRARRVASARLTTRKVDEHGLQGQLIARWKARKAEHGRVACPARREAECAPSDKLESDEAPPQHPRANDDARKFKTTSARSRPPRPHSHRHLVDPQPIAPSQAPRDDSEHNALPPSSTRHPEMSTSASRQFPAASRARSRPRLRLILPNSALCRLPPDDARKRRRVCNLRLTASRSTPLRRFRQPQDTPAPVESKSANLTFAPSPCLASGPFHDLPLGSSSPTHGEEERGRKGEGKEERKGRGGGRRRGEGYSPEPK